MAESTNDPLDAIDPKDIETEEPATKEPEKKAAADPKPTDEPAAETKPADEPAPESKPDATAAEPAAVEPIRVDDTGLRETQQQYGVLQQQYAQLDQEYQALAADKDMDALDRSVKYQDLNYRRSILDRQDGAIQKRMEAEREYLARQQEAAAADYWARQGEACAIIAEGDSAAAGEKLQAEWEKILLSVNRQNPRASRDYLTGIATERFNQRKAALIGEARRAGTQQPVKPADEAPPATPRQTRTIANRDSKGRILPTNSTGSGAPPARPQRTPEEDFAASVSPDDLANFV